MARVRLEGVRKVYDNGHVAVHDVSLEVADGEFVVLVGPSGSGKSTVLRMIAGLESISHGKLYIGDPLVNDVAPKDRDIAMVFQNYALYPHMSVRDNLAFALKLRKLPPADVEQRIAHAADFLGLTEIMDRKPAQLSGGQRQRVAVGRALVREPQVFLFDEPLSNLDAKLRVQMRREIAALHRRLGVTMIYVTHDQVEAMTLGDRVAVLAEGKLQQIGTPMELYDYPANLFVAGFIGSPAMNFIPGKITGAGVHFRSDADGFLDFDIPALQAQSLAETTGSRERPAILGIRPEAIYPVNAAYVPADSTRATLELDVIEPLGNEILLQARASGQEIVARVAPQTLPSIGASIELAFDLSRLHFFDPATERTIGADTPAQPH